MARIADKHGLTNVYRPYGSKRLVKRGRPRKYLFGAPSRKRRTYSSNSYKRRTSYNTSNIEVDTSGCATAVLIPFFVILLISFSLIPIFRCLIPVIIGAGALWIVEDKCKKAWGLPTGRWSKPVSIGWTILTAFAMFVGLIIVLLIQIAHIPIISIIVLAIVYVWLSVLILHRRYNQINPEVADTSNCATIISVNDKGGNKTKPAATASPILIAESTQATALQPIPQKTMHTHRGSSSQIPVNMPQQYLSNKQQTKLPRKGFMIPAIIFLVLTVMFFFLSFAQPNMWFGFCCFGVLAGMLWVLAFSTKDAPCLFGKQTGIPKKAFVIICSIVAFLMPILSNYFQ